MVGWKYANFQLLRETQDIFPRVSLKVRFRSNREEADHSMKKESLRRYAMGIIQALLKESYAVNN